MGARERGRGGCEGARAVALRQGLWLPSPNVTRVPELASRAHPLTSRQGRQDEAFRGHLKRHDETCARYHRLDRVSSSASPQPEATPALRAAPST
eukprot:7354655-Prymnesium_polylepis.4